MRFRSIAEFNGDDFSYRALVLIGTRTQVFIAKVRLVLIGE
jgi:hypothetical protein